MLIGTHAAAADGARLHGVRVLGVPRQAQARRGLSLTPVIGQPAQVRGLVDVVQHGADCQAPAELADTLDGPVCHLGRAPRDPLERPRIESPQSQQYVTAIERRVQHRIAVTKEFGRPPQVQLRRAAGSPFRSAGHARRPPLPAGPRRPFARRGRPPPALSSKCLRAEASPAMRDPTDAASRRVRPVPRRPHSLPAVCAATCDAQVVRPCSAPSAGIRRVLAKPATGDFAKTTIRVVVNGSASRDPRVTRRASSPAASRHIRKIVRQAPRASHLRADVSTGRRMHAGRDRWRRRLVISTSSISGWSGNPPTASNAARVMKSAWSPVAMPLRRERRFMPNAVAPMVQVRTSNSTSKRPQTWRPPASAASISRTAPSGSRVSACRNSSTSPWAAAAPAFI